MDHHFYSHKSWKLKNGFPQDLFPLQKVIHVQPSSGVQKKPRGLALGLDYIIPIPWLYGTV